MSQNRYKDDHQVLLLENMDKTEKGVLSLLPFLLVINVRQVGNRRSRARAGIERHSQQSLEMGGTGVSTREPQGKCVSKPTNKERGEK